jgi:hypothetical protein
VKKIVWAVVLFCLLVWGGSRMWAAPKTDQADYKIAVHVSGSRFGADGMTQILSVTIDGKHYELLGGTSSAKVYSAGSAHGLLNPGDYQAKLIEDIHKTGYESIQMYELLLPDGATRKFSVTLQSE